MEPTKGKARNVGKRVKRTSVDHAVSKCDWDVFRDRLNETGRFDHAAGRICENALEHKELRHYWIQLVKSAAKNGALTLDFIGLMVKCEKSRPTGADEESE